MEEWAKLIVSQGFAVFVAAYFLVSLNRTLTELRDGVRELVQWHKDRGHS